MSPISRAGRAEERTPVVATDALTFGMRIRRLGELALQVPSKLKTKRALASYAGGPFAKAETFSGRFPSVAIMTGKE